MALGLALVVLAATIAAAASVRPIGLTEVLLVVLAEVVGVALVAGPAITAATSTVAFLAVNWFIVPPYGTLHIQAQGDWVSLGVFLLLSVGVSSLVESVLRSETAAAAAAARESAIIEVMRPESASAADSLRAFRSALDLDVATLVDGSGDVLLRSGSEGDEAEVAEPVIEVRVAPGFALIGRGRESLGINRDFARTLATAVVRAWESQQLVTEQERSARLAELDGARATLLASVGHDLRTPLAGIRVSADALALSASTLSDGERAELLQGLRQSAIRLDEVLGAVLDSSRIEAGIHRPDMRPTDLREVAARAVDAFQSPRVTVIAPDRPVVAPTDPALLERIIANLVANALDHTPEGSPVEVTFAVETGSAHVRVVDHGPGLVGDSADVGRSGHGMGLLIVERLAGYLGSSVAHDRTPGGGLTATVRVPT